MAHSTYGMARPLGRPAGFNEDGSDDVPAPRNLAQGAAARPLARPLTPNAAAQARPQPSPVDSAEPDSLESIIGRLTARLAWFNERRLELERQLEALEVERKKIAKVVRKLSPQSSSLDGRGAKRAAAQADAAMRGRVLTALFGAGAVRSAIVAAATGIDLTSVRATLKALRGEALVAKEGQGRETLWALTKKGQAEAAKTS